MTVESLINVTCADCHAPLGTTFKGDGGDAYIARIVAVATPHSSCSSPVKVSLS